MTFDEYQTEARKTATYPSIGHDIIYPTLGLTGEAGEVADKVKKLFRDKNGNLDEIARKAIPIIPTPSSGFKMSIGIAGTYFLLCSQDGQRSQAFRDALVIEHFLPT